MIDKIKKIIGVLFLSYMVITLFIEIYKNNIGPTGKEISKQISDSIFKMEIKGKVTKIFNNRSEHNVLTYIIKSENIELVFTNTWTYKIDYLQYILETDDSLYKPAYSFTNFIYKKGDKTKLLVVKAYSCNCGDSIPAFCDSLKYD